MKIKILSLLLCIILFPLFLEAAEIYDDQLLAEIEIIPNAESVHLKTPGSLTIQEANSPFQIKFNNPDLIIELYQKINVKPVWRVGIKEVESLQEAKEFINKFPETTYTKEHELKFYKGAVFQKNSFNIYKIKKYSSYKAAKNDSDIDNWIEEDFVYENSEIYIFDQNTGEDFYISAPIKLTSSAHITVFDVPKYDFWNPKNYVTRTYYEKMQLKLSQIGKMNLISVVELEKYVAGVLPHEIGLNVPMETMRAQAIAARSEALFKIIHQVHKQDGFDLCASVHCQVYSGISDVSPVIKKAVRSTDYEIGIYNDKIINAVYSTNCGGMTVSSKAAWGGTEVPYLVPQYDAKYGRTKNLEQQSSARNWLRKDLDVFCNTSEKGGWKSRTYRWLKEYSIPEFENLMNKTTDFGNFVDIDVLERGKSGRVSKLQIEGSNSELVLDDRLRIRQLLGGLRSTFFLVLVDETIRFLGKGSGHGVGMCQMGAIEMGHQNYSAEEILKHYFTGIKIKKINLR